MGTNPVEMGGTLKCDYSNPQPYTVKFQKHTVFQYNNYSDGYDKRHMAWDTENNNNPVVKNGMNQEQFALGKALSAFMDIVGKDQELTENDLRNLKKGGLVKSVRCIDEAKGQWEVEYYANSYHRDTLKESSFMRFDFETEQERNGTAENSYNEWLS